MQVQARSPLPGHDSFRGLGVAMSVVLHLVLLAIGIIATRGWNDPSVQATKPLKAYLVYAPVEITKQIDQPAKQVNTPPAAPKPSPVREQAKPAVHHETARKVEQPAVKPQAAPPVTDTPAKPEVSSNEPIQTKNEVTPTSAPQPVNTAPKVNAQYAATNPKPVYPPIAKRLGQQGTVELRVLVSETGTASKVEVLKSSGYGNLDAAAVQAISRWRFEPATQNNKPVAQWLTTRWTYELQN